MSTKTFTRSQILRLLTRSCIEGPAKFACRDFNKTIEEVFDYLRVNYGNPRMLLNQRLRDLRDLGACLRFKCKEERLGCDCEKQTVPVEGVVCDPLSSR